MHTYKTIYDLEKSEKEVEYITAYIIIIITI